MMPHNLYRDKTITGYTQLEIVLEQQVIDWLEERAILEDKTVDETVEEILEEYIRDAEVDDTPE